MPWLNEEKTWTRLQGYNGCGKYPRYSCGLQTCWCTSRLTRSCHEMALRKCRRDFLLYWQHNCNVCKPLETVYCFRSGKVSRGWSWVISLQHFPAGPAIGKGKGSGSQNRSLHMWWSLQILSQCLTAVLTWPLASDFSEVDNCSLYRYDTFWYRSSIIL